MDNSKKDRYKINEIKSLMSQLLNVFDIVRLVDPVNTSIVTFDKYNNLVFSNYICFLVWKKDIRCKNCVSMRAVHEMQRKTKYEFIDDDIYYVVSKPIILEDNEGEDHVLSIEIVSDVSDEMLFEAFGKNDLIRLITENNEKLYIDSLTNTYNRRFFDEGIFLSNKMNSAPESLTFILIDIKHFKSINDDYGHDKGDLILKEVGKTLMDNVRADDPVIRIGGDEFLVVMRDCSLAISREKGQLLQEKLGEIVYDDVKKKTIIGNYGVSFSNSRPFDTKELSSLLKEADVKMYIDKNRND